MLTTEAGGPRGYDAGKKINGRKRHALVDTDGRGLVLEPHPASIQDRDSADFAVAAVAIQRSMNSVGIDIEPNSPLRPELLDLVASPAERAQLGGDLLSARLLFSIKEAVYKATHPLDGQFLNYSDVEVDLDKLIARTVTGHNLRVFAVTQPRILTLTTVPR